MNAAGPLRRPMENPAMPTRAPLPPDCAGGSTSQALQSAGILSVLVFLINVTYEVLVIHGLYTPQYFLIALLHGSLSSWALAEIHLVLRRGGRLPLGGLRFALGAQLAIGVVRHLGDFSSRLDILPHAALPPGPELGAATLFVPLSLLLFLAISKLLIDAFSEAERQRANELEIQMALVERTQTSLRESEERYRLIADRVDDLIWAQDPGGRFTYLSPSAHALLGFGPAQLLGREMTECVAPDSRPVVLEARATALKAAADGLPVAPFRGEIELAGQADRRVWAEVMITGLYDAQGGFAGFAGIARDSTERRASEQALRQAHAAAEVASKAKTDFLNNLSHEIRTPMNAIIGLGQLTLDSGVTPQQAAHLRAILTSSQTLLRLLNDILDLAKMEAGQMRVAPDWFDVRELLEQVADLFRPACQAKGLSLQLQIGETLPRAILSDDLRLRQVLVNLLGNAVKFTERGSIRLAVAPDGAVGPECALAFRVSDTGIGMTPAQLEQLFQPFVQADASVSRRFGGSGLGLSISSRLVELLGGRLDVTSQAGAGTAFFFSLPVACRLEAAGAPPAPAPLPASAPPIPVPHPGPAIPAEDRDALSARLGQLDALLATNLLEAQQVSAEIETLLADTNLARPFAPLGRAVQQLKFREARHLLAEFAQTLHSQEMPHV